MRHFNFNRFWMMIMMVGIIGACEDPNEDNSNGDQEPNDSDNPGTVNEDIQSNTTWENRFDAPDQVDYVVENTINVAADLSIEPGVRVELQEDVELNIKGEGILKAIGTADEPIIFEGAVKTPGHWRGIWVNSPSSENKFNHVIIRHAGSPHHAWDGESSLWLASDNNAQATIQNTVVEEGQQHGLHLDAGVKIPDFKGNTFRNNGDQAVSLYASDLGKLDKSTDFGGKESMNVEVHGNPVTENQTWKNINSQYEITSNAVSIEADVTIEAGADFRLSEDNEINVYPNGSLNAIGESDNRITFKGATRNQTHGYWRGIWINSASSKNRFEHVEIAFGGSRHHSWDGESVLWVAGDSNGNLTLQNCELHHNTDWGLTVNQNDGATITPSSASEIMNQNDFHDNGLAPDAKCSGDCHVNIN